MEKVLFFLSTFLGIIMAQVLWADYSYSGAGCASTSGSIYSSVVYENTSHVSSCTQSACSSVTPSGGTSVWSSETVCDVSTPSSAFSSDYTYMIGYWGYNCSGGFGFIYQLPADGVCRYSPWFGWASASCSNGYASYYGGCSDSTCTNGCLNSPTYPTTCDPQGDLRAVCPQSSGSGSTQVTSSSHIHVGVIVGSVSGAVVGLLLAALGICVLIRRRRKRVALARDKAATSVNASESTSAGQEMPMQNREAIREHNEHHEGVRGSVPSVHSPAIVSASMPPPRERTSATESASPSSPVGSTQAAVAGRFPAPSFPSTAFSPVHLPPYNPGPVVVAPSGQLPAVTQTFPQSGGSAPQQPIDAPQFTRRPEQARTPPSTHGAQPAMQPPPYVVQASHYPPSVPPPYGMPQYSNWPQGIQPHQYTQQFVPPSQYYPQQGPVNLTQQHASFPQGTPSQYTSQVMQPTPYTAQSTAMVQNTSQQELQGASRPTEY